MRVLPAVLAIVAVLAALWFGFNYALWGRITGPPTIKNFEAIAREGQPILQAICDYRSDHGLLPESWNDLVPAYLPQKPKEWSWEGTCLTHRAGYPHTVIGYWFFEGDSARWYVRGEYGNQALNVPNPVIKKSSLPEGTLLTTRLTEYEKRINANPQDIEPYRDEIAFAVFSGSNDVALGECERAAKLFPNWWLPPMALAVLRTNDTQAEEDFKSWVQAHPTFINYWYLSRFYQDKNNNEAAFAALDKAAQSSFTSQAADVAELQRQLRLTVQAAAQGKRFKPPNTSNAEPDDAYWTSDGFAGDAAKFCGDNRRYDLALKIIQHCELGNMQIKASAELGSGQFDAAIADAQSAAQSAEPQSYWKLNLPLFLEAAKAHNTNFWCEPDSEESTVWALFQKPRELSSEDYEDADNVLYRAFHNGKNGNLDAAIADCTKAIQLNPRSAKAYNLRGWDEFLKKDFDAAINDASRAIQLNLNDGNAYGTRGWARQGKGDNAGALDDLKTAIEISGMNSREATEDRGMIEFINGHYQNAISLWQKAVQMDPSTQKVLEPWIEKATQSRN